jgi:type II secretory pathway pseudopilin PulG
MILRRHNPRTRQGFTLVELMVAAALAITIMWILAESFKMGIDFARSARSTGEMMNQLNNAGQIMNRDLNAQHFLVLHPGLNNNNGKLSSQRLDLLCQGGNFTSPGEYTPPNGYFQIVSPPPVNPASSMLDNGEGFLLNTMPGGTTPLTSFSFTIYNPTGLPQNLFSATDMNGNPYAPQRAAEVTYFLQQSGQTPPTPGLASQPLFTLFRRQRLVAANTNDQAVLQQQVNLALQNTGGFSDSSPQDVISITVLPTQPQQTFQVNTLSNFGTPYTVSPSGTMQPIALRGIGGPTPPPAGTQVVSPTRVPQVPLSSSSSAATRAGDDVLLNNVLSFEVLPAWDPNIFVQQPWTPAGSLAPLPTPRPFTIQNTGGNLNFNASSSPLNSNYPFDNLPQMRLNPAAQPFTFDTWLALPGTTANPMLTWNNFSVVMSNPATGQNPNLLPMPIRVTALQITLRIYDPKTKQARQNTWRVSM